MPRRALLGAMLTAGLLAPLAGCAGRGSGLDWSDIPATPGAEPYEGAIETIVDTRLAGRLAERRLRVLGSRLELLPAGVAWAQHRTYRDDHAGGLRRIDERVPEPDAPVLTAEYSGGRDRMLFVIARATDDRTRLVVLTALTAPR